MTSNMDVDASTPEASGGVTFADYADAGCDESSPTGPGESATDVLAIKISRSALRMPQTSAAAAASMRVARRQVSFAADTRFDVVVADDVACNTTSSANFDNDNANMTNLQPLNSFALLSNEEFLHSSMQFDNDDTENDDDDDDRDNDQQQILTRRLSPPRQQQQHQQQQPLTSQPDDDDEFDWLDPATDSNSAAADDFPTTFDDDSDDDQDYDAEFPSSSSRKAGFKRKRLDSDSDSEDDTDDDGDRDSNNNAALRKECKELSTGTAKDSPVPEEAQLESELFQSTMNLQKTLLFNSLTSLPSTTTKLPNRRGGAGGGPSDQPAPSKIPRQLFDRMVGDITSGMLEPGNQDELLAHAEEKITSMLRDWPQAVQLYYIMACLYSDAGQHAKAFNWIKITLFLRPFSATLSEKALNIAQDLIASPSVAAPRLELLVDAAERTGTNTTSGADQYSELLRIAYRNNRKNVELALRLARDCITHHRLKFARYVLERTITAYEAKKQQQQVSGSDDDDENSSSMPTVSIAVVYEELGNLLLIMSEPTKARTYLDEAVNLVLQQRQQQQQSIDSSETTLSQDLFISWSNAMAQTGEQQLALHNFVQAGYFTVTVTAVTATDAGSGELNRCVLKARNLCMQSCGLGPGELISINNSAAAAARFNFTSQQTATLLLVLAENKVLHRLQPAGDALRDICSNSISLNAVRYYKLLAERCEKSLNLQQVAQAVYLGILRVCGVDMELLTMSDVYSASSEIRPQSTEATPAPLLRNVLDPYLYVLVFDVLYNIGQCYETLQQRPLAVEIYTIAYKTTATILRSLPAIAVTGVGSSVEAPYSKKSLKLWRRKFEHRMYALGLHALVQELSLQYRKPPVYPRGRGGGGKNRISNSALYHKYNIAAAWNFSKIFLQEFSSATTSTGEQQQRKINLTSLKEFRRDKQQKRVIDAGYYSKNISTVNSNDSTPQYSEFHSFLLNAERVICHHMPAHIVENSNILRKVATMQVSSDQHEKFRHPPDTTSSESKGEKATALHERSRKLLKSIQNMRYSKTSMQAINEGLFDADGYWQFFLDACDFLVRFRLWQWLFRWSYAASCAYVVYARRERINSARLLQALAAGHLQMYSYLRSLFRSYVFKQMFASPLMYAMYTQLQREALYRSNDWRFERQFSNVYCEMRVAAMNAALRYLLSGHYTDALVFLTKLLDDTNKPGGARQEVMLHFYNAIAWTGISAAIKVQPVARVHSVFMANYFWNRFLELKGGTADALYSFGNYYAGMGNCELARKYYQQALEWRIDRESGVEKLLVFADERTDADLEYDDGLHQHFIRQHDIGCEALYNWCATYAAAPHEWPNMVTAGFLATQHEPPWQRHVRLLQYKYRHFARPSLSANSLRLAQSEVEQARALRGF